MTTDSAADLLSPLEPAPAERARLGGTIRGPAGWAEGLGAGLECWSARLQAWVPLGEVRTTVGCLVLHQGRLSVSLSFDLGPMSLPRRARDEDAAEAAEIVTGAAE